MQKFIAATIVLVATLVIGFPGQGEASGPDVNAAFGTVTGSVGYPQRIALPPNAVVQVELADVSRADAAAFVLATQQFTTNGRQIPLRFALNYDRASIDARFTYSVRARILVDGELWWTSDTTYPVVTNGVFDVDIQLTQVAGPSPDEPVAVIGVLWMWQQTQMSDGALVAPDDPTQYTLELLPDGLVAVQADCNRGMGSYTLDGNRISIGPLATTLAACAPGSMGSTFLTQLGSAAIYFTRDADLYIDLEFDSGTMRFESA